MLKTGNSIRAQLIANQVWETVAFAAKAGFLFLLTPLMIKSWGDRQFGEYALASSLLIFLSMIDVGIRGTIRVNLSTLITEEDAEFAKNVFTEALLATCINAIVAILLALIFTLLDYPSRIFGISQENHSIILVTTLMSSLLLILGTACEPLVAEGKLGELKLALAIGFLIAIPATWLTIFYGSGPIKAIFIWQFSLAVCLVTLLIIRRIWRFLSFKANFLVVMRKWPQIIRRSFLFHIVYTTGLGKTHGLTLLISAISGPSVAGSFFIILRLAEIVSSLGAVASELLLSALPSQKSSLDSWNCLISINKVSMLLGGCSALLVALFGPVFLQFWLQKPPIFGWMTGALAGLYGLATAYRLTCCYALIGFGKIKMAAKLSMLEGTIALMGSFFIQKHWGLEATLGFAVITVAIYLPGTIVIKDLCRATWISIWVWPWTRSMN